jgi:HK97 family phage major capsid protein
MPKEVEVKDVMEAFEEFKKTNDERLKEIEKRGAADPVLEAKLAKIEVDLARGEDLNQKVTLAQLKLARRPKRLPRFKEIIERIEAKAKRPGAGGDTRKPRKPRRTLTRVRSIRSSSSDDANLTADERKELNEFKTLYAGNDTLGGYYLAPPEMATDIIKQMVLQSPVRSIARVTSDRNAEL